MIHRTSLLPVFLFIGIPLSILSIYFSLNSSGFCFAKMRYLSDYEKLQGAFDFQNHRDKIPAIIPGKKEQLYDYIRYKSFDEYIKQNPDCCSINPGGPYDLPPPDFLDRIFGFHSGDAIVINFKARYLDEIGKQRIKEYKVEHAVQNCGQFKW
jgi:hypothetical protein